MTRWMFIGLIAPGLLFAMTACEPLPPCERYVDYMCTCHDGPEDVPCGDLEATYLGADTEVQNECVRLLDEQQEADGSDGTDCGG